MDLFHITSSDLRLNPVLYPKETTVQCIPSPSLDLYSVRILNIFCLLFRNAGFYFSLEYIVSSQEDKTKYFPTS